MDEFGCYDFKKPPNPTDQDMRTSYYRGHRHITDTRMGNNLNAKFPDRGIYCRDPLLHEKMLSEYGDNYEWKYGDPHILRNPSMNMKMQFMKCFEDGNLRFIKRSIKPMTSVTQDTYLWTEPQPIPEPLPMPQHTPVAATPLIINRNEIGYTKYLDPSATTYNLSYVGYTPNQLQASIAAHDNLTFWNWNEHMKDSKRVVRAADAQMCDDKPSQQCPKRRCEYQNQLKSVPHSGLRTEVRDNYMDPKYRKDYVEFDMTDVRPILVHEETKPIGKSEYSLYGSREPVMKYV